MFSFFSPFTTQTIESILCKVITSFIMNTMKSFHNKGFNFSRKTKPRFNKPVQFTTFRGCTKGVSNIFGLNCWKFEKRLQVSIKSEVHSNTNEQKKLVRKITHPIEGKPTKNLVSFHKEVPILRGWRVDDIYPNELVKIFFLLEYAKYGDNFNTYEILTGKILRFEDNYKVQITVDKESYNYLQKLDLFIENLKKDPHDFEEFKKKYQNKEYILNKMTVRLNWEHNFWYPYFKEVDN